MFATDDKFSPSPLSPQLTSASGSPFSAPTAAAQPESVVQLISTGTGNGQLASSVMGSWGADVAADAVSGSAGRLPPAHLEKIQHSFGPKVDVSPLPFYSGPTVAKATTTLNAEAFTCDGKIAGSAQIPLHTAAHEAAHAVQQCRGLQLYGGFGQPGDAFERHADAVADRVVAGQSAEDLLNPYLNSSSPVQLQGNTSRAVQRRAFMDDLLVSEQFKPGPQIEPVQTEKAIAENNHKWPEKYRQQILSNLRALRGDHHASNSFESPDVQQIAQLQRGVGIKQTGILDDHCMAVLFRGGFTFSKDTVNPTGKLNPSQVQLEFFPGELEDLKKWKAAIYAAYNNVNLDDPADTTFNHLTAPAGVGMIYVRVNNLLVASYHARGGPPPPDPTTVKEYLADRRGVANEQKNPKFKDSYAKLNKRTDVIEDGQHFAEATHGSYTVGPQQKGFVASSWGNSQIPWGARIRRNGSGYEFSSQLNSEWDESKSTKWTKVPAGLINDKIWGMLPSVDDIKSPDLRWWNRNDFGEMAWELKNSPGFYLHTTPESEEAAAQAKRDKALHKSTSTDAPLGKDIELTHSHGCVHLNPIERDEMIALGYLQPGVRFICKDYKEHLLPEQIRQKLFGLNAYNDR